jgi:hypothetical protein
MGAHFRIDARIASIPARAIDDLRRAPRTTVAVQTVLRALGTHGHPAIVRDISASGFMAETEQDFIPGETARLQLPDVGFVSARVIWSKAGKVGGAFDQPIKSVPLSRLIKLGTVSGEA